MKEELLTALNILNKLGKMETEITQSKFPKSSTREINYIVIKIRTDKNTIVRVREVLTLCGKVIERLSNDTLLEIISATDDADYRLKTGRFTKKQY